ncbi:MAG: PEGA domain-containing protein [Bradymonadaceae bacterium]|nr:PEGA domain-containing protein [Lujinxingiaceae bacterium]
MMYRRNRFSRHARPTLLLGVLLGMCLLPSMLAAQEAAPEGVQGPRPKVFLIPTDSVRAEITPIVTERVGESLRERLRADGRIELLGSFRDIQRQLEGGGQHSSATIAEAERLYTSGIGLLTAGDNQRAAETFQRSVDLMEQNIGDLHNFDVLADALVNLALAYFQAGFDLDSRKYMHKYAHLRPAAKFDAAKFPKGVIEIATDEQDRVQKAGNGKLVVNANVAGAAVFIDGVAKGETPVTIEDVGFGTHYLVVRDKRGGTWSEEIRVRGRGREQVMDVKLGEGQAAAPVAAGRAADGELPAFYTDLREVLRTGKFGVEQQPYLREVVGRTGGQFVAWVVMVREGSNYVAAPFVYRASDGLIVQATKIKFNMELSNLRAGVNQLSDAIIIAVEQMPMDQAISVVDLNPAKSEQPAVAVAPKADPATKARPAVVRQPGEDEVIPPPKVMPSESRSDTWTYVGWGSAAVLIGGAIAGSIYLLAASGDDPSKPVGFEAEVSW